MPKQPSEGFDANPSSTEGLTRRTVGGFALLGMSSGFQALLRLAILAILARLLTQEDFGLASAGLTIVSFATIFSQLGLDRALIQRADLTEAHLRTAATVLVVSGLLAGAVVAASAPLIAAFFQTEAVIPVIRVAAISFPLQGLVMVPAALLQRKLRFKRFAGIDVIAYLGGFGIVGIGLALAGFGVWSIVGATLAQGVIAACWVFAMQPFPKRPLFDRKAFKELAYYGSGFIVARGLNQVGGEADNLVVGRWLGIDALGIYGRAYQMLVFPVNIFSNALSKVLFPSLAHIQKDIPRLAQAYKRATAVTALAYLPLSAALIVMAPEIVSVLLGPNWQAVVAPFQILAVGLLFRANKVNLVVAQATGAVYNRAWREGIYGVFVLVGALIGMRWGLVGVSVAVLIALLANFILMSQLTLELTGVSWQGYAKLHLPALHLSVLTLALTWLVATSLRAWEVPSLITLVCALAIAAAGLLLVVYLMPRIFLGQEGTWMLNTVVSFLPKRVGMTVARFTPRMRDNVVP